MSEQSARLNPQNVIRVIGGPESDARSLHNVYMRGEDFMRATDIGMVPLGYGRFVRADESWLCCRSRKGGPLDDEHTSMSRGSRCRSWPHAPKARSSPT